MRLSVVVTGASGFVGQHVLPLLRAHPAVARVEAWSARPRPGFRAVDLRDRASTAAALQAQQPAVVLHLAAVAGDRDHDEDTLQQVNVEGVMGLLDGLGAARMVAVSTGYVYGLTPSPARESDPRRPLGPYAASKARMEDRLVQALPAAQLRILRPFNHSGPGQPRGYLLPDLAHRLLHLRPGEPVARGSLQAVRDLGDVRDLAAVLVRAVTEASWPALCNVCTGSGRSVAALLAQLAQLSGVVLPSPAAPASAPPPALLRSVGDPSRLRATGFQHRYALEQTLQAVLADARAR